MATSGTTVFSNTARDVAHAALQECGIIPLGETMEAAEMSAVLLRLNGMLKSWQARGVTWKQETISQAITANTASATLPVNVRGVNGARFVISSTNERPLQRWERDQYYSLPNKAASGTPTIFHLDRNTGQAVLYVWPVPTANGTVKLDIDRAMDTVTDGSETIDIPEEWAETVYTNLAVRCARIFGAKLPQELVAQAAMLERELFDEARPASYWMGAA